MLSGPDPYYTDEAIRHGVHGTMVVECHLMTNGCLVGCQVVQSLPYMDEAVLDALRRRHYKPTMLDGKPVNTLYRFKIVLRPPSS